jgi:HEPN domain-containing protein
MSKKDIDYGLKLAEYDFETAKVILKSKRYVYVLFACPQALEKSTKKFPPRIHDLTRLAKTANLKLSEEQKGFLGKLSFYYIESRYPGEIEALYKQIDKALVSSYLLKAEEFLKWLKQKLL